MVDARCRWPLVLVFAGLLFSALIGGAPRAEAHAVLVATSPVDGAALGTQPHQVTMRFNEAVAVIPNSVELLDAAGHAVPLGRPHLVGDAHAVAADLRPGMNQGTYVVSWRVVSEDGHAVSGAFQFSVGQPSAAVTQVHLRPSQVPQVVKTVGEGLAYLGFAGTCGGAVFLLMLVPVERPPRRGRLVIWNGLGALALGTLAVLLAQYPYSAGRTMTSAFSADALRTTLSTASGQALLARSGITALLAVFLAFLVRGRAYVTRPTDFHWALPAQAAGSACLLALPLTWTLVDHSRSGEQVWVAVPMASLHLLAVGLWLGGLIALAVCAAGSAQDSERLSSTKCALVKFSRLALPCFAVIVLTGLYASWRQVGTLPALTATEFGRLLLIKVGGVVLVVVLAWQARRFVHRRLTRPVLPKHAWRLMRRSLGVEAVVGIGVLAVATVLGNTAPARTSYAPPVRTNVALPATGARSPLQGGHVEVLLSPGKQGLNVADIYLVGRDGDLVTVSDVSAQLAPNSPGNGVAESIKVSAAEPGHYVATTVSIPSAGRWQLQLYVRTSEFDATQVLVRFQAH